MNSKGKENLNYMELKQNVTDNANIYRQEFTDTSNSCEEILGELLDQVVQDETSNRSTEEISYSSQQICEEIVSEMLDLVLKILHDKNVTVESLECDSSNETQGSLLSKWIYDDNYPTMIGSSIVKRLSLNKVYLQAIGGLKVSSLRQKIHTGTVKLSFPVIGLLVGGNDLANGYSPVEVAENFKQLIVEIHNINPIADIVIVGIPPRPYDLELDTVVEYNALLSHIETCDYTNKIHEAFYDDDGHVMLDEFDPNDYWPRLHPTVSAKRRMAPIIENLLLNKLLNKGYEIPRGNVMRAFRRRSSLMMDTSLQESTDSPKKHRKRMKKLNKEIIDQMEFYFSDANLHKDRFLKQKISQSPDGYIDLQMFSNFKKLMGITTDLSIVAKALQFSELIEVSADGEKIRRTRPLTEAKDVDERTVYVECLPRDIDHDWVRHVFGACGKVVYVSLPKYQSTGDFKGFGFVEYEKIEEAEKACEMLNNPPVSGHDRVGQFPAGNKEFIQLSRQTQSQKKQVEKLDTEVDKVSPETKKNRKRKRHSAASTETDEGHTGKEDPENKKKVSTQSEETETKKSKTQETDGNTETATERGSQKRPHEDTNGTNDTEGPSKKRLKEGDKKDEGCRIASAKRPLSDASDEEIEVKRSKTVNESSEEECEFEKKKSKKRKNRRKDKEKDHSVPELRVLPKKKWLELKKEYLKLQKRNIQALKKSLLQQKEEKEAAMQAKSEKEKKAVGSGIEFTPGVIVKVQIELETTRTTVKELVGAFAQVAYVDFTDQHKEGHIRCQDAENAKKLSETQIQGYTFTLLSGDEEKQYWEKIFLDRQQKLNMGRKSKKKGSQKIIDKADKQSAPGQTAKHVFFDD